MILIHPNDILRIKCVAVKPTENVKCIISELKKDCITNNGLGLAANQIGYIKRIFVMLIPNRNGKFIVCINPKILSSKESITVIEGCLSIPGKSFHIKRYRRVLLSYMNENWKNETKEFTDMQACCVQQEIDHLNGILLCDKQ